MGELSVSARAVLTVYWRAVLVAARRCRRTVHHGTASTYKVWLPRTVCTCRPKSLKRDKRGSPFTDCPRPCRMTRLYIHPRTGRTSLPMVAARWHGPWWWRRAEVVAAVVVAKREVEARRRRVLTVCSIHPSNAATNNRYTHPQFD